MTTLPASGYSVYIYVMERIYSFLLLAVFTVVTLSVYCKDLQPLGLYRRTLTKLYSKLLSNRANTLRSGGEVLNNIGKKA